MTRQTSGCEPIGLRLVIFRVISYSYNMKRKNIHIWKLKWKWKWKWGGNWWNTQIENFFPHLWHFVSKASSIASGLCFLKRLIESRRWPPRGISEQLRPLGNGWDSVIRRLVKSSSQRAIFLPVEILQTKSWEWESLLVDQQRWSLSYHLIRHPSIRWTMWQSTWSASGNS